MKKLILLAACGVAWAAPASAEVKNQSDAGFVVGHTAEVLAKPDEVWKRLIQPKDWWNVQHSWFGKADGFYLDAQAGGCFCETKQEKGAEGQSTVRASVEHMRVIFADPGKVLRMQGALGPLQSEAVLGTLTIAMEPLKDGAGTRLSFNYTVGGYTRFPMAKMATAVDAVIGEQFQSLIKPLGKVVAAVPGEKEDEWKLDLDKLEDSKGSKKAKPDADKPKAEKADGKDGEKAAKPK